MKKVCRCIRDMDSPLFKLNENYYYKVKNHSALGIEIYPYYLYRNKDEGYIGNFSHDYFKIYFIDIQKERRLKLKKLNENRG